MDTADKVDLVDSIISDLVTNFLYYDRKEDEDLPQDELESMVEQETITVDWIVERFEHYLRSSFNS